jgi:predicted nicotinamide N-methyase
VEVVELGCGLGIPSLVAAARGARVTSVDWADEAVELLRRNAAGNGLEVDAVRGDWSSFEGAFELALGADLLYEERNGVALLEALPSLAPRVLLAEPGRPPAAAFFGEARRDWHVAEIGDRVYELTRGTRGAPPAHEGG